LRRVEASLQPLYHQFGADHQGEFSWRYLEQRRDVWRIEIGHIAARQVAARQPVAP
jgi:uncharacterized protein (DUF2249 family)